MKFDKPLSWKPRRRGHIYCSPACGGKCTWEEYQLAHQRGRDMCLMMDSPKDWKPRVWENIGWHVEIVHAPSNGCLRVSATGWKMPQVKYHADLNTSGDTGCDSIWYDSVWHTSPQRAVNRRLKIAWQHVKSALRVLGMTAKKRK